MLGLKLNHVSKRATEIHQARQIYPQFKEATLRTYVRTQGVIFCYFLAYHVDRAIDLIISKIVSQIVVSNLCLSEDQHNCDSITLFYMISSHFW